MKIILYWRCRRRWWRNLLSIDYIFSSIPRRLENFNSYLNSSITMTSLHYPSIELCRKLTEIGFLATRDRYEADWKIVLWESSNQFMWAWQYVCPSVMEMLDVMPADIKVWSEDEFDTYDLSIFKLDKETFCIRYSLSEYVDEYIEEFNWHLPNVLAEMVLWLHQNNYISFTK